MRILDQGCKTFTVSLQFALLTGLAVTAPSQELPVLQIIPLGAETYHVQGIDVEASKLWVTSVDVKEKRGLLFEFELPTGKLLRSVELQHGEKYHPGGLMAAGDSIWIPVAEYKRSSSAVIQRRSKQTLELQSEFRVNDHIGAIAVVPEGIVGANWDARDFYVWDRSGKLLRKVANPAGVAFQDMKFVRNRLVAGGLASDKSGAVVFFDWPSLEIRHRMAVGRTDTGLAYTHEGLAVAEGKLYLLPEDSKSRLFVFEVANPR